ncbi:MAG TPA: hypothetical protein VL551_08405 [Actinospica sp.]|jgi:hypothetical protein|nr:hypothetical protein [Actinospica sp.]
MRVTRRTLASAVAAGLLCASGCSSSGPARPAAVVKASQIADVIKQYVDSHTEEPITKMCEKLFPTPPYNLLGTTSENQSSIGADTLNMETTVNDMSCEYYGATCDISFDVSTTSSGSVDPVGLVPNNGHYEDYAINNGIEIEETAGSDTDSTQGCVISIAGGKQSIDYLNDALARISDN